MKGGAKERIRGQLGGAEGGVEEGMGGREGGSEWEGEGSWNGGRQHLSQKAQKVCAAKKSPSKMLLAAVC